MGNSDNESAIGGRSLELLREPALLLESAFGVELTIDIGVEPNDRCQRSIQRPIDVGLRHRGTMFEKELGGRRTEILHETIERRLVVRRVPGAGARIAVVIAGN